MPTGFTIPNVGSATYSPQAGLDNGDITILAAGAQGYGVVGGCVVTPQGTPNMQVTVSAGIVNFPTLGQVAVSTQTVTHTTANSTNPRFDLVVIDTTGVASILAGTPAAVTTSSEPVYPTFGNVIVLAAVYVQAATTTITSTNIVDKRMIVPKDRVGQMNTRVAWQWPFTSDSTWNLPIATTARFQRSTDAATASFIATSTAAGTITPWITYQDYNLPIFKASATDPLATMTDTSDSTRSDTFRIPASAAPATGTDHSMGIVTPDGRFLHETWLTTKTSTTVYSTSKHVKSDLYGRGNGPNQGVHASGQSIAAGVLREWEIYGGTEGYGEIRHALCIGLDPSQLLVVGATYAIDAYGRGTAGSGYVFPATEQDSNCVGSYTGSCPMGALAAIPPWVDITSLGLSGPGRTMARALQNYGAYVCDATGLTWGFYCDNAIGVNHLSDWLTPAINDLGTIRAQMRVVANNTKYTPGGGVWTGDASNRVAPLAPPLPAPPYGRPT